MNAARPMVTFVAAGPITVGAIAGNDMLDGMTVGDFGRCVLEYVEEHSGLHLLLDFEKVTFMSSAALTELLRINQALRRSNGDVRLCNLSRDIRKVFRITNLDALFAIHDDEDLDTATRRFERSLAVAAEDDTWAQRDPGQ